MFLCRFARKFGQATPFCGIVDIDVQRQTTLQAMYEAAIHGIVHLVVYPKVVSLHPQTSGRSMEHPFHEFFGMFTIPEPVFGLHHGLRILLHETFCTTNGLQA